MIPHVFTGLEPTFSKTLYTRAILTTLIRNDFETSSFIHNLMNDAVPTLTFVELFALALFSIITVRRDYAGINRYCKIAFVITAGVNMLVTSAVVFAHKKNKTQTGFDIDICKSDIGFCVLLRVTSLLPTSSSQHFVSRMPHIL
ncbi:hypothetical protein ANCDUO_01821 [Ancylostoma duodenale]|uniref:Uncharacterized protein n=1 Tax=Ancylostoma duodenale TaxID=51022 RepID=A0A0C2DY21_9BILA|nr:hypothetical protein ANCDUO_01821 [Ancylostoma duodenale]